MGKPWDTEYCIHCIVYGKKTKQDPNFDYDDPNGRCCNPCWKIVNGVIFKALMQLNEALPKDDPLRDVLKEIRPPSPNKEDVVND